MLPTPNVITEDLDLNRTPLRHPATRCQSGQYFPARRVLGEAGTQPAWGGVHRLLYYLGRKELPPPDISKSGTSFPVLFQRWR